MRRLNVIKLLGYKYNFNPTKLSKLRRDFSSAQPLNKNITQRFQHTMKAHQWFLT